MGGMAIYLDDEAMDLAGAGVGAVDDLRAVLVAARERLGDRGRVVVEVEVDGRRLGTDELERAEAVDVRGREVRLVSEDPRSLAVEALEGVRDRLHDAEAQQERAADLLQRGDSAGGLRAVGEAVHAWSQTQAAVLHASSLLGVDVDALDVKGARGAELRERLVEQLRELTRLIGAGDTVALADALAYEWPETTRRWDTLIEALVARIEQGEGDMTK